MTGENLAGAARALIGVPFRLHGRDPAAGLDCLGLVAVAAGRPMAVPNGYSLRAMRIDRADAVAAALGLEAATGGIAAGDVLMLRPGPCQYHLAIALGEARIVHAHAGLRRVVIAPLPREWPLTGHWRARFGSLS
ncbi:NlpC/P60 family protein [Novosphingobium aerophilum]|uniref:NlpC/P60 family protein n=1 Tax=Novosphingobium TaxID=165696 RepID=UPI0006C87744|nr:MULTISPECIES: NlpC/P60 family protein [unclassified Novosphingobium]KPH57571.1 hypothetical protein ADT71_29015 [Novosphingobium sp. ST904]TCM43164.1 hypothetical protein EDF59_101267 [Novosphingobium sp. ST904]WRT93121.1 NlpC/P60 family protein [Novosphingobium sp. RL4]